MHLLPKQVRAIVVAAHIKTIGGGSIKISSKCTRPPLGGSGSRDYVGICAFLLGPPSQFAQLQVVAPYSAMLLWLGDMEPVKVAAVKSTRHRYECLEED